MARSFTILPPYRASWITVAACRGLIGRLLARPRQAAAASKEMPAVTRLFIVPHSSHVKCNVRSRPAPAPFRTNSHHNRRYPATRASPLVPYYTECRALLFVTIARRCPRARKQTNFTALQNRLWKTFKLPPAAQQFVYGLNRGIRECADRASGSMRAASVRRGPGGRRSGNSSTAYPRTRTDSIEPVPETGSGDMAFFCPVASRIRHIAARSMPFKQNEKIDGMPQRRRWLAASAGAALLATTIGSASAQMAIPGKFQVNAAGGATYTIPIAVPPGIAGMTPSLTLEYNSHASNGILGMGWSLGGLPAISRCAATIAQDGARGAISYTATDRFCLDGQRLVAMGGTYGGDGTEYRTEVDSFSRIKSYGNAGGGPAWFEVRTKSGQIMQFGNTPDSQIIAQGTAIPRAWLVNKVSDTVGNFYTVQYQPDANGAGQAYPQSISYAGNTISFIYATTRPDPLVIYEAGAKQKVSSLLTNVQTSKSSGPVADYRLAYQQTSGTHRSILTSVTLCDRASTPSCLPATNVGWNTGSDGFALLPENAWLTPGGGDHVGIVQGDVNGDGRGDLVAYIEGNPLTVLVMLSNGDGSFSGPFGWTGGPACNVDLVDIDGDGRADFVSSCLDTNGISTNIALSNGQTFGALQTWGSGALPNWSHGVDFSWDPPDVRWKVAYADVNGDGRADLITYVNTGDGVETYTALGLGNGQFAAPVYNLLPGNFAGDFPGAMTVLFLDLNGDGRVDILANYSFNQTITVSALSNGDGTFTPAPPTPGGGFGPQTIPGDFNGDGRIDVATYGISHAGLTLSVIFSKGDGTFDTQNVASTFFPGDFTNWVFKAADLNGDGRADGVGSLFDQNGAVVRSFLANGDGTFTAAGSFIDTRLANGWQMFTTDIDGDGRSDIVAFAFLTNPNNLVVISSRSPSQALAATSFTTGLGATTSITYAPLTNAGVYTKGSGAVYPQQDVQGPLYVVSQVDAPTGIGNPASYTSTYHYWSARLDLAGRGFLGFAQMNVNDAQTGITTATGLNQTFPFIGMAAWEWKGIGPQTLNSTTNTYQFFNASGASSVSSPSIASAPYRVSLATRS